MRYQPTKLGGISTQPIYGDMRGYIGTSTGKRRSPTQKNCLLRANRDQHASGPSGSDFPPFFHPEVVMAPN